MTDLFDPLRLARLHAQRCLKAMHEAERRRQMRAYRKWCREARKATRDVLELEVQQ